MFLIIDGFSLVFRAFYALPDHMRTPDGQPINAIYGLITQLIKAIETVKPTHVCVCLDSPEPTFRDALFTEYKANRPDTPDLLSVQLASVESILTELKIPVLRCPGFEADDIIGTLSYHAGCHQQATRILTSDMDILQLVNANVHVWMPVKKEMRVMDVVAVKDKYGILPSQVIDYKALKGDVSDNIPGVKGIGDKTAVKLLNAYHSLEGIYQHIDEIQSVHIRKKLNDHYDLAKLSYQLATIRTDLSIETRVSAYHYEADWAAMVTCFNRLGFQTLAARYRHDEAMSEVLPNGEYQLVETEAALKAMLPALKQGFAIDIETTSADPMMAQLVGMGLATESGQAVYVPMTTSIQPTTGDCRLLLGEPKTLPSHPLLRVLKTILEDEAVPKIVHHSQYAYRVLKNYDITLRGLSFDTMIAAFLVDSTRPVGLNAWVHQVFGVTMRTFDRVVSTHGSFQNVPLDQAVQYAGANADYTWQLAHHLRPQLEAHHLLDLLTTIELPLVPVLGDMSHQGVCISQSRLAELQHRFSEEMNIVEADIYQLGGTVFNIKSTQQLAVVLFDTLGLPVIKKTKTGRSTNGAVLTALKGKHAIVEPLLRYRLLEKLCSTYVTALPRLISPKTGRIHTFFHQTIAVTGRLSSTSPNLQNIPIRTTEGSDIRSAFVPSQTNNELLSADYSQIELRVLAHFCKDPALIAAYRDRQDIHAQTASLIFNVSLDAVTASQRYMAKSVNFGIIYGQSAYGLAGQLQISRSEAKAIIDTYFLRFPAIQIFIDNTIQAARDDGYVRTLFGRIRALPDIHSTQVGLRQYANRMAVNTLIQGTAADLIKKAMITIHQKLCGLQSTLLIQVHDELVFDVVPEEKEQVVKLVVDSMTQVVDLQVPLVVDTAIGANWQVI